MAWRNPYKMKGRELISGEKSDPKPLGNRTFIKEVVSKKSEIVSASTKEQMERLQALHQAQLDALKSQQTARIVMHPIQYDALKNAFYPSAGGMGLGTVGGLGSGLYPATANGGVSYKVTYKVSAPVDGAPYKIEPVTKLCTCTCESCMPRLIQGGYYEMPPHTCGKPECSHTKKEEVPMVNQFKQTFDEWFVEHSKKINEFWLQRLLEARSGEFRQPTDEETLALMDKASLKTLISEMAAYVLQQQERNAQAANPSQVTGAVDTVRAVGVEAKALWLQSKLATGEIRIAEWWRKQNTTSNGKLVWGKCKNCGDKLTMGDYGFVHLADGLAGCYTVPRKGNGCAEQDYVMQMEYVNVKGVGKDVWMQVVGTCAFCSKPVYRSNEGILYHLHNTHSFCSDGVNDKDIKLGEKW